MAAGYGKSHVSKLSDSRLAVTRSQATTTPRMYHVLVGISGAQRRLEINNADIDTLSCALLERMYYCKVGDKYLPPPEVTEKKVFSTLAKFRLGVLKHFGPRPIKLYPEEFVEKFHGRRRKLYENALEEFDNFGVLRKHSESAAFVKCEKVDPTKAPRCIQPRNPVYNIGLGCYIKDLEHDLYSAIGRVFGDKVVVVKGLNVREIGNLMQEKWESFNDPIAIGLDATKFDMHVSAAMLKWEHSVYLNLYGGDKELRRLLNMQINNIGVGYCEDGKLRYKVQGRRFSGDMNTALGNCLIMCAMVYSYAEARGVRIKLVNNGDDCVVFMERKDELAFTNNLDSWFLDLGFRMTREPTVDVFEQVEFCQMRPVHTTHGITMVRNFDTAREKDSLCILPINIESAARKWMYAVGECGLALCSGVPIMQELYHAYMRNGLPSNIQDSVQMQVGSRFLRVRLDAKRAQVTDEARLSFWLAWGYTPDEQIALEEYYRDYTYSHTIQPFDKLYEIDSAPF